MKRSTMKRRRFNEEKFRQFVNKYRAEGKLVQYLPNLIDELVMDGVREFAKESKQLNMPMQRKNNPSYWLGIDAMNDKIDELLKKFEEGER